MTARYNATTFLPGYTICGLKGWDDFVVSDSTRQFWTVPTVPFTPKYLKQFAFDIDFSALRPDGRFANRIKWYVQPIIFGGNPQSEQNLVWLTLDQHTEAVNWWNAKYRELR